MFPEKSSVYITLGVGVRVIVFFVISRICASIPTIRALKLCYNLRKTKTDLPVLPVRARLWAAGTPGLIVCRYVTQNRGLRFGLAISADDFGTARPGSIFDV